MLKIGDIVKMPKDQFEIIDLVLKNEWIVTGFSETTIFVKAEALLGWCNTGIKKRILLWAEQE